MKLKEVLVCGVGALALAGVLAMPAEALTLKRADLDKLVAGNSAIVVARVDGASPYLASGTKFVLTDFRVTVQQVLKGNVTGTFSVTMMGGTVGDLTTLIPGGAVLMPGRTYVLFLRTETLPGTRGVATVGEHTQGVFDIAVVNGVKWAVSQAAGMALIRGEDDEGEEEEFPDVPGGAEGMSLDQLVREIQRRVKETAGGEVKR